MTTSSPLEVTVVGDRIKLAGLCATYYLTPEDAHRLATALTEATKKTGR